MLLRKLPTGRYSQAPPTSVPLTPMSSTLMYMTPSLRPSLHQPSLQEQRSVTNRVILVINIPYTGLFPLQVAIPEDAKRTSDRLMEEILIPHTSVIPPTVGDEKIRVDQLDQLAQLVFKGTKTLNKIQTVVFDSAYYTNENLLISAPTGAGKTNIAMLTVLHEIKKNIDESGVIQRNSFKVGNHIHTHHTHTHTHAVSFTVSLVRLHLEA